MLGTNILLGAEKRNVCVVYGLVRHLNEKYPVYHGHVETYKDILEAAENRSEDERKKIYTLVAEFVGDNAGSDEDFHRLLKHEKIEWNSPRAIELKLFLGMLAVENGRTH